MTITFPTNPPVGTLAPEPPIAGAPLYRWDGAVWNAIATPEALTYVRRAGDVMTGLLSIKPASVDPALILDKSGSGGSALVVGETAGKARWGVYLGDTAAETGGNAGSNFAINRFDDAGSYSGSALTINRATGAVVINAGSTITGGISGTTATFSGAISAGSVSSSGSMSAGSVSASGAVSGGSVSSSGAVSGQTGVATGPAADVYAQRSCIAGVNMEPYQNILFQGTVGANRWTQDGNLVVGLKGYQPGGGSWADSASDARVKNVHGDYTRGLDDVCALHPVNYSFKGNDTPTAPKNSKLPPQLDAKGNIVEPKDSREAPAVPYPNSEHYQVAVADKTFTGLIAQEVELVFPEMVTQRVAFIDGKAVNDMRGLDTTPLIFALVNAVKELNDKIEALKNGAS